MINVLASDITNCVVGVTLKWAVTGKPELIEALRLGPSAEKSCSPVVIGKSSGVYCIFRENRCWGRMLFRSAAGEGIIKSAPTSKEGLVCKIMASRMPPEGAATWLIDDSYLSTPRWC